MKKTIQYLAAGALLVLLPGLLATSCIREDNNAVRLQVKDLPETVTFAAVPAVPEAFTIDAKEIWVIRKKGLDWISVDPGSGGSGTYPIHLSSDVNEWEFPREGELIIASPSFTKTVKVVQEAAVIIGAVDYSGFEGETFRIPSMEGSYSFEMTANLEWTVSLRDLPWATVSPTEGVRKTPTAVTVSAQANEVTEPRTGYIDFTMSDGTVVTLAVEQEAFDAEISLSVNSVTASASGAVEPETVILFSNAEWTSSSDADWLSVEPASGEAGETPVKIIAGSNATAKDREGKVVFDNHGRKMELTVTQYWERLDLSAETVALNPQGTGSAADGAPCQVDLQASGPWTVSAPDWITVSPTSGDGDAVLTVRATQNDIDDRQGEITVTCGRLTGVITVSQEYGSPDFIDLVKEQELVWPTKDTKAAVEAYSPEWVSKGIGRPSTHADLAYCQWVACEASLAMGFDLLYVIASNGNLVSRNNWTDDALVFHIPVLSLPAGKTVRFLFNMQGLGGQPAYWAAEINLDGTWVMMDTGATYQSPNLQAPANLFLSVAGSLPFEARYVVPETIKKKEIQLRIRVADGTFAINGTTISTVAGKSSSLRFQANSNYGGQGMTVRVE